jgi:hypothetical protein
MMIRPFARATYAKRSLACRFSARVSDRFTLRREERIWIINGVFSSP